MSEGGVLAEHIDRKGTSWLSADVSSSVLALAAKLAEKLGIKACQANEPQCFRATRISAKIQAQSCLPKVQDLPMKAMLSPQIPLCLPLTTKGASRGFLMWLTMRLHGGGPEGNSRQSVIVIVSESIHSAYLETFKTARFKV